MKQLVLFNVNIYLMYTKTSLFKGDLDVINNKLTQIIMHLKGQRTEHAVPCIDLSSARQQYID